MRICFLYGGGTYATDGGIGFLRNLCSQLRELGNVCYAILGGNEDLLLEGTVNREIHVVGDWSLGQGLIQRQCRKQLREALNDLKPDIVHIIHPPAYYGSKGHIHALPVAWRDFPVVTTFWGFNIGRGATMLARSMVLLLLWGSKAIASHDFKLMGQMRQLCLGLRPVHFLPVGSNIQPPASEQNQSRSDLRRRYRLELDARYIGYFGGFDQSMGVNDLFKAMRLLREEGHDRLRLLLIGWQRHLENPRFNSIMQSIEREHLGDVAIMTPFAPEEEVADLMKAVDLVALPYRQNSMGRSSLMAALCAGAPVILASSLTDLGSLNEAVCRVPPQSPEILAQQVKLLLDDPLRRKELGLAGRRVWEQNFSWPVIAEKHLQIYHRVLQAGTS